MKDADFPTTPAELTPLPPEDELAGLMSDPSAALGRGLVKAAAALTLALRRSGSTVGLGSLMDALRAVDFIGPADDMDLRQALAANLTASRAELETFNRLFDRYFLGLEDREPPLPPTETGRHGALAPVPGRYPAGEDERTSPYSPAEVLATRDLRDLAGDEEKLVQQRLIRQLTRLLNRPSRRRRPGRGGNRIDFRRTLRRSLSLGGEPLVLVPSRRRERPRRLLLLLDVSGSMDVSTRTMIHFAKAWLRARPGKVEVYAFSTRLRRLTRIMTDRPLSAALEEIGRLMPEWSGGTRIGGSLAELLSEGSFGPVSSSTVTAIWSDGWDRGDIDLLERQMARLARRSRRVAWLNPLMGDPQYQPICAGMRAALPYVDRLIPAHSLETLLDAGRILEQTLKR